MHLVDDTAEGIEPTDLFDVDAGRLEGAAPISGRLRTRNRVGTLEVLVQSASGSRMTGLLDIHSTKLDYDSQYRWMLSGVAEEAAALLLRSFAPTTVGLTPDPTADAETLFQQIAFLSAILRRPHTAEAIERVLRAPHVTYVSTAAEVPIGRGLPGSSAAVRAIGRPGARIPARGLVVTSLPGRLQDGRLQTTVDNPPNQFVRFAIEYWAAVLDQAAEILTGDTADDRRGRREVAELSAMVEGWRTDRRLRDVGALRRLPSGNQVILRQPGYREIHQALIESRSAAMLRWEGGEVVHQAGQRDVSTLYEYWCYLELRRLVERLCDHSDSSSLTERTPDGMHLVLRRGKQQVISGFTRRAGRLIDLELWFNRSFGKNSESWTMQMRPDCSLRLQAQTGDGQTVETWVHFDAKYRIESTSQLFVSDDEPKRAQKADFLKMHAYRDGIRQSAGAYILFPGTDRKLLRQYHELLPGLGAFAFVPGSDGHATAATAGALTGFLEELLDHVAQQASNRERAAYWTDRAHEQPPRPSAGGYVPLRRPPADTPVLLGYSRSAAHAAWTEANGLYNMRFGDRPGAVKLSGAEASAELLVLWTSPAGPVRVWWLEPGLELLEESETRARGYPSEPQGSYLCRVLGEPLAEAPSPPSGAIARATAGRRFGAPVTTTWAALMEIPSS